MPSFRYFYIVMLKICLKISTQSFFTAYEPITEYFLDLIHTFFTLISTASTRHWRHYSGRSCKNPLIWLCHPYVISVYSFYWLRGGTGWIWEACQIVDRSKWLNRISRYSNFVQNHNFSSKEFHFHEQNFSSLVCTSFESFSFNYLSQSM